jgi:hypothetical protein
MQELLENELEQTREKFKTKIEEKAKEIKLINQKNPSEK